MASSPSIGYNMAGQGGSTCVMVESPEGSAYSNLRGQDRFSWSLSNGNDLCMGANYRISTLHDGIVKGLSTLSLHAQYAVDSVVEDSQASQLGSAFQSPEIYRCTSPRNNESSSIATVAVTVGSKHLSHTTGFGLDFVRQNVSHENDLFKRSSVDTLLQMNAANRVDLNGCSVDVSVSRGRGFQIDDSRSFHNPLLNHNVHDYKIAEDTNVNSVSESSDSSEICMPDFSSSSGEASHILDGTEAQSANKEDVGFSCPVGTPGQPKKGLSRFYAGKARSFSCLRDVISVKDLAKPESPYTKKRRLTSSTSRLPPLQKNCSSISKKPLQSCKSNLLLAVAMSTEDEDEKSPSGICPRQQAISAPTRCYSLSDLQGARGSLFFIG